MTVERCKTNLARLLKAQDLRVIALSGEWGTGKTHLWKSIQRDSGNDEVKSAAVASLFGVRDIAALQLRVLQSASFKNYEVTETGRALSKLLSAGGKVLKGLHGSFSAIDDLTSILFPSAIKGKLIVIDDIERKHDSLSADEVLGFIDECCTRYGCRVLLILNEEKLQDAKVWETFREKIIDAEVRLDTTPEEAFAIAQATVEADYSEAVLASVVRGGIRNIRIIQKVIRAVNEILAPFPEPHQSTIDRVIPSVVLLGFAHFKGMDDTPNLDHALEPLDATALARLSLGKPDDKPSSHEESQKHWLLWLRRMDIVQPDQLEAEIVKYYRSGLLNTATISELIKSNETNRQMYDAQSRAGQFLQQCYWHPKRTEESLVAEAAGLIELTHHLNANLATSVCTSVSELKNGDDVGRRIIDSWLTAFHAKQEHAAVDSSWINEHPRHIPVHPRIKAAFNDVSSRQIERVTIGQASLKVHRENAWGRGETSCLSNATIQDYIEAITDADSDEFTAIMIVHMRAVRCGADDILRFGSAADNFIGACKSIIGEGQNIRLIKVIRRIFAADECQALID